MGVVLTSVGQASAICCSLLDAREDRRNALLDEPGVRRRLDPVTSSESVRYRSSNDGLRVIAASGHLMSSEIVRAGTHEEYWFVCLGMQPTGTECAPFQVGSRLVFARLFARGSCPKS
jgi:hypothetical protein